jgi:hypothetical protein
MSEQTKIIDPAGRCVHDTVKRITILSATGGERYDDVWMCSDCKVKFFLSDLLDPLKIKVMETSPTLRDQFAMAALTGMLAGNNGSLDIKGDPDWAYKYADSMLEARK